MTTLTPNGVDQLIATAENNSTPVVVQIKKIDFKSNMVIIVCNDDSKEIKCWSKDAGIIDLFKTLRVGNLLRIQEWSYLTSHKIVNIKRAEAADKVNASQALQNNNYTMQSSNPGSYTMNQSSRAPMGSMHNTTAQSMNPPQNYPRANQDRMAFEESFNTSSNIIPIAMLNPQISAWKIKAKVVNKSAVRTWNKGDKQYSKFSITLADNKGGKIEGVFWGEAIPRFFDLIEEDKVYEFSNGQVRPQQMQYRTTDHSCSISFNADTVIMPCEEKFETLMTVKTIADLTEPFGSADLLLKVISHGDIEDRNTKNGPTKMKRCTVTDTSLKSCEMTLWGATAEKFEAIRNQLDKKCIIALQNAGYKNSENYGRQIMFMDATKLILNPVELRCLKDKYQQMVQFLEQNENAEFQTMSAMGGGGGNQPLRSISFIQSLSTNQLTDKRDKESVKSCVMGVVTFMKKPDSYNNRMPWYWACPNTACSKKVDEEGDTCHACNQPYQKAKPRFIQRLGMRSREGTLYAEIYDDMYSKMIDKTCEEYVELWNLDDEHKEFAKFIKSKAMKPIISNIKSFKEEWDGNLSAKNAIMGNPEFLYECEGGDAEKSFTKLYTTFNKLKGQLEGKRLGQ